MAVIAVDRGDKVKFRSEKLPTSTTGTIVAVFLDLQNRPCAAVQWAGGVLGCSRLSWLVKV